jgi:SLT domain-containing protein
VRSTGAANPGQQAVINEIRAVFGPYSGQALNIARCESGYNPSARNSTSVGGAHAAGVFQILDTSTWRTTAYAGQSPYNAYANIHAAYQIFQRDGYSWREWQCRA